MLCLKLIFSLFLCIIIIRAGFIQDKLSDGIEMHFDRLDSQCRGRNVPSRAFISGFTTTSTKLFVENCTVLMKEGGFKKLSLHVTINRCRSKENLDTCEQFLKRDNIDFCKAIDPSNPLVGNNPLYTPFVPPMKCPIKKGIYKAFNVTYDIAPFVFFKLDGWYWRVKAELISEENKLVFCNFIEGYVTNSKSKSN